MNEELLLTLPNSEWLRRLKAIRASAGPLSDDDVKFVEAWLRKTLSTRQLADTLDGYTGQMECLPLTNKPGAKLSVHVVKANGTRQPVMTFTPYVQKAMEVKAFRNAINAQTEEFREQWLGDDKQPKVCEQCKSPVQHENGTLTMHVDHVLIPFRELLSKFKRAENMTTFAETHREKLENGVEVFMLQDLDLRNRWQHFHQQHAQLRMLCVECNLGVCKFNHERITDPWTEDDEDELKHPLLYTADGKRRREWVTRGDETRKLNKLLHREKLRTTGRGYSPPIVLPDF